LNTVWSEIIVKNRLTNKVLKKANWLFISALLDESNVWIWCAYKNRKDTTPQAFQTPYG
jgi:hypothetical protein